MVVMTLSIEENIMESFEFAKEGLVGEWMRWLLLIVLSIIPILNFITYGYIVAIYRGGEKAPELSDWWNMLIDGVKLFIIGLVYMLIPLCILVVAFVLGLAEGSAFGIVIGIGIAFFALLLACFFGFIGVVGCIRFAKLEDVMEAFNISAILALISEIGWGHYLLSYLVFLAICCIIAVVLNIIPIIGALLFLIVTPVLLIWQGKFYENLYSLA